MPCWRLRGTSPEDFGISADTIHTSGSTSASLISVRSTAGFGTLYQFADATALRGKRIEFTADLRTFRVEYHAGLFVRIDDADGNALALDNLWYSYEEIRSDDRLVNRSLRGDQEWSTLSIVIDVPEGAHALSYGAYLFGGGQVWIDNARLETVTNTTPVTGLVRDQQMLAGTEPFPAAQVPQAPRNLDFEKNAAAACGPFVTTGS